MNNQFPKFRAWVKSETGGKWFMSYPRWIDLENKRICTESGMQPKEFILMQDTGRTDKNGVLAYAYDICMLDSGYHNWVIKWHDDGWMIHQEGTPIYKPIPDNFIITDNIYEPSDERRKSAKEQRG